jgi:hypothetical protein
LVAGVFFYPLGGERYYLYQQKEYLHMPQKDMSSKLGTSSSPVVNRVIENNKNVQQPVAVPAAVKTSFNKQPVKI